MNRLVLWFCFVLLVLVEGFFVYRQYVTNPIFYHDPFDRERSNEAAVAHLKEYKGLYALGDINPGRSSIGRFWHEMKRSLTGGEEDSIFCREWVETVVWQHIRAVRQKDGQHQPLTRGERGVLEEYEWIITLSATVQFLHPEAGMTRWEQAGRCLGENIKFLGGMAVSGGVRLDKGSLNRLLWTAGAEWLETPGVREYLEYQFKPERGPELDLRNYRRYID